MMISTRGRYALRVMADLAEHNSGAYIPLKEIAQRQNISQKYMETIMAELSKNWPRGQSSRQRRRIPVEPCAGNV